MNAEIIEAISRLIVDAVIVSLSVYAIYDIGKLYKDYGSTVDEHTEKIKEFEKRLEKIGG